MKKNTTYRGAGKHLGDIIVYVDGFSYNRTPFAYDTYDKALEKQLEIQSDNYLAIVVEHRGKYTVYAV